VVFSRTGAHDEGSAVHVTATHGRPDRPVSRSLLGVLHRRWQGRRSSRQPPTTWWRGRRSRACARWVGSARALVPWLPCREQHVSFDLGV